ncbi:MAG: tRNA 2-thiouridine(34) synthase MnmA [Candidatus Kerfeldbacteria bacterium]|nr:tRNA 2-thiouridine(34) synthase MnmA [Candidatus Kerfeldbacteria bacterium]
MNENQTQKKNVVVALSGGVDSAVAAAVLKEQGYDVRGVYMENWKKSKLTPHCTTEEDRRDALRVALHLGIPFDVVNFEKEYEQRVVDSFYREYAAGRTPNPDVVCNKEIKFRAFLDRMLADGADLIATGHYARVVERDGRFQLLKGIDPNKDQSYFLHTLTQEQLRRTLFPIGGMTKPEVRAKAKKLGLPNADKPDSQGICFVGPVNIVNLLKQRIPEHPGPVLTAEGVRVGEHRGLAFYTIGQREGLGIGGGVPYYVAAKEPKSNTLVVAHGNRDAALYSSVVLAAQPHWIAGRAPSFPLACTASLRYRQEPLPCVVESDRDTVRLRFGNPQRAVTPGQSVVFYDDEECLGGAVIEGAERDGYTRAA